MEVFFRGSGYDKFFGALWFEVTLQLRKKRVGFDCHLSMAATPYSRETCNNFLKPYGVKRIILIETPNLIAENVIKGIILFLYNRENTMIHIRMVNFTL